jgi:hypothetical protein
VTLPDNDGSSGGSGGDSGTDLPLLGLLALIPIACCFAFFLLRRSSEDDKKKKNILVNAQAKDLALHTVYSGSDDAPDGFDEQNPMYKSKDRMLNIKDSGAGEAPESGVENLNAQAKDLALNTVDSGSDDTPESPPTGGIKLRAINISFEPTSVA